MMYIVSPLAGLGGGILWRPHAYSFKVVQKRLITVNIHEDDDANSLSTQMILPRVFKTSAFVMYSCFEWCTPLVNGLID